MEIFRENGFEVEVWEASKVLLGDLAEKLKESGGTGEFSWDVTVFHTREELIKALRLLDDSTLLLPLSGALPWYDSKWIYESMACLYGVIAVGAIPWRIEGKGKAKKLRKQAAKIFQRGKLKDYIKYKFAKSLLKGIPDTSIVIVDSYDNINFKNARIGDNTVIVPAHTFDYDAFLDERDNPEKSIDDYAVFLDDWMPFHTDYDRAKSKPPVTPEEYYYGLCGFFESIERAYGLPVWIAAHPRSLYHTEYHKTKDWYRGREIICGKTVELVHNSKFVICHASTAVNYAVLFKKPLLFITTDQMEREVDGIYIRMFAQLFNKKVINVDKAELIDWDDVMKIDRSKYAEYRDRYIKMPGTPDKKLFQIMTDAIKEYGL
jgi:hypothetical protein